MQDRPLRSENNILLGQKNLEQDPQEFSTKMDRFDPGFELLRVGSGVTISKSVKKIFFHIFMKFEHFKGLTLNLEVPQ